LHKATATASVRNPLDRAERRAVLALILLCLPTALFWASYEQSGNTISLWAEDYTDRHIDLIFWKGEIPVTWFQSVNPLLIIAFTPAVVGLWARQADRGTEPSTVLKMSIGCFGVVLANLFMLGAVWQSAGGPNASWLWLMGYFVLLTVGELYLSPIGLSLVTKLAPGRMVSMLMGVWLGSSFIGDLLAGWLGSFWSAMDKSAFFALIATIAGAGGIIFLVFDRPLRGTIEGRMRQS
jgi:POT family proton-dependent oligopeptide transporter